MEMAGRSQQLAAVLGFPFVELPEQVAQSMKAVLRFMVEHLTARRQSRRFLDPARRLQRSSDLHAIPSEARPGGYA